MAVTISNQCNASLWSRPDRAAKTMLVAKSSTLPPDRHNDAVPRLDSISRYAQASPLPKAVPREMPSVRKRPPTWFNTAMTSAVVEAHAADFESVAALLGVLGDECNV